MSNLDLFWRLAPIFFRAFFSVPAFSRYVERRKLFPIRYALSMIVGLAFSWAIRVYLPVWNNMYLSFIGMILVYGMVNLATACCYKASFWTVALISSSGYAVQDLTGHIKSLILLATGTTSSAIPTGLNFLIEIILLVITNTIIGVRLKDKPGHGEDYLDNRRKALLSIMVMLICIGMGRLTNNNPDRNILSEMTASIYAVLVSIMLLLLQYFSVVRAKVSYQADMLREMMRMQRLQFESNKTNVQLVNEKYHDIQKLLRVLDHHVSPEQIEKLRNSISGYDAQTSTGNEVLDVILTEKRMLCASKKIQFTSMVDVKALDFVEELDLYSLFSNLLSNSVDAVGRLPQGIERFITLTVRQNEQIVSIHAENPCVEQLTYENGLPVTSSDPEWHGFGMKSMARIAEKYGGTLSVKQENNLFRVDILLFPPETVKNPVLM